MASAPYAILRHVHDQRSSSRTAERGYQFPPSDGDWHVPLSVRWLPIKRNDSTLRASSLQRSGGRGCRCCAATAMTEMGSKTAIIAVQPCCPLHPNQRTRPKPQASLDVVREPIVILNTAATEIPWHRDALAEKRRSPYQAQRISGNALAGYLIDSLGLRRAVHKGGFSPHSTRMRATCEPTRFVRSASGGGGLSTASVACQSIMPRKYPVNVSHQREMLGVAVWRGAPPLPYAHRPFCTPLSKTVASNSDAQSYRVVHRSNHSVSCFLTQRTSPGPAKSNAFHRQVFP
jgi:hypothetical protein